MTLPEYNAFLVNNRDRLVEVFGKVSEHEIGEIQETDTITQIWSIPPYQYYKQHKKMSASNFCEKNVFEKYGSNILIQPNRTLSEIVFEEWCEKSPKVKWIYKNGDKGDEYFSIVYRRAFRRNNFYPDYIIGLENGDIWIIEAKGGMTADGTSSNIDGYAEKKFNALKEYAAEHKNVKWGFVRAVGPQLYLSNTEWSEDMTNADVWKPIDELVN